MTDDAPDAPRIPPPPVRSDRASGSAAAAKTVSDAERATRFISLPPGLVELGDSATHRVPRPEREQIAVPAKSAADEISFFPAPLGAPVGGPRGAPVGGPAIAQATWSLVLPPDSFEFAVDGAVYVGRNPSREESRPHAAVLAIVDPEKSVSKTHALFEVDGEALWVHDLNSTNGVFVLVRGAEPTRVDPSRRAMVPPGSTVELGRYEVRVSRS